MATAHDNDYRGNFYRTASNEGRMPIGDVRAGVEQRFAPSETGVKRVLLGGIGSSGRLYSSSALRRTHRPRNDH